MAAPVDNCVPMKHSTYPHDCGHNIITLRYKPIYCTLKKHMDDAANMRRPLIKIVNTVLYIPLFSYKNIHKWVCFVFMAASPF